MIYDTVNPQYPSFGPCITTSTVHWETVDTTKPTRYFLLQDGGYAQELARLVGTMRAPAWVGRNRVARASGQTKVAPSEHTKRAAAQQALPNPIAAPSMIDDMLRAALGGAMQGAMPEDLQAGLPHVLKELTGPLLVPAVVASTIDGGANDFLKRSWLTRHLDQNGVIVRALRRFQRWVVKRVFGTDEAIAERALTAMVSGGNVSPDQWAAQVLGYEAQPDAATRRVMLLAMGRDAASGTLHYSPDGDRLVATLDLFDLAPGYSDEERLMADVAKELGGELRTNPAWAFLGKPITVHNQGGCPMSGDPTLGVTSPDGKVHGCEGLFVLDGAALCTSVGVNPSATITAMAERNVREFIRTARRDPAWPANDSRPGVEEYRRQYAASRDWGKGYVVTPPDPTEAPPRPFRSEPLGIAFDESMQGYGVATADPPRWKDAVYRALESEGRPSEPVLLTLTLAAANLPAFFEDMTHTMTVTGTVAIRLPGDADVREHPVEGVAQILAPRIKPHEVPMSAERERAQRHFAPKEPPAVPAGQPDSTRFLNYLLRFKDTPYTLFGYKRVRDNPALDSWRDTSTLFVTLYEGTLDVGDIDGQRRCVWAGAAHVELTDFLFKQLRSLRVTPNPKDDASRPSGQKADPPDPARVAWATASFAHFFFGELLRVYAPGIGNAVGAFFRAQRSHEPRAPRQGCTQEAPQLALAPPLHSPARPPESPHVSAQGPSVPSPFHQTSGSGQ
jgi:hypothetical protein